MQSCAFIVIVLAVAEEVSLLDLQGLRVAPLCQAFFVPNVVFVLAQPFVHLLKGGGIGTHQFLLLVTETECPPCEIHFVAHHFVRAVGAAGKHHHCQQGKYRFEISG